MTGPPSASDAREAVITTFGMKTAQSPRIRQVKKTKFRSVDFLVRVGTGRSGGDGGSDGS